MMNEVDQNEYVCYELKNMESFWWRIHLIPNDMAAGKFRLIKDYPTWDSNNCPMLDIISELCSLRFEVLPNIPNGRSRINASLSSRPLVARSRESLRVLAHFSLDSTRARKFRLWIFQGHRRLRKVGCGLVLL